MSGMSRPAIIVAALPPRGAADMASLLLLLMLLVEANEEDDDDERAVEDETPGALVVDTNAAPDPWRLRLLLLAVLRTGLNEYAEP